MDNFFALKLYYQGSPDLGQVDEDIGEQRAQFDTLRIIQSETTRAFREVMTEEYNMLKAFRP